jgi:hypothetical protein
MEERLGDEALLWLTEREKKYARLKEIPEDVIEALSNPVAVKVLMATFKGDAEIQKAIQTVIENMANLSKDKRKEMLKYCQ